MFRNLSPLQVKCPLLATFAIPFSKIRLRCHRHNFLRAIFAKFAELWNSVVTSSRGVFHSFDKVCLILGHCLRFLKSSPPLSSKVSSAFMTFAIFVWNATPTPFLAREFRKVGWMVNLSCYLFMVESAVSWCVRIGDIHGRETQTGTVGPTRQNWSNAAGAVARNQMIVKGHRSPPRYCASHSDLLSPCRATLPRCTNNKSFGEIGSNLESLKACIFKTKLKSF